MNEDLMVISNQRIFYHLQNLANCLSSFDFSNRSGNGNFGLAGGTEVELIDDGSLGAIAGGVTNLGCPAVDQ